MRDLDLEIGDCDVLMRAFDYYSKSLKNLEEYEEPESMPLLEGEVESSLLEIDLIKRLFSENSLNLPLLDKKSNFISSILKYYKNELDKDIEELENSSNKESEIQLLQEEINKINNILQKL